MFLEPIFSKAFSYKYNIIPKGCSTCFDIYIQKRKTSRNTSKYGSHGRLTQREANDFLQERKKHSK